VSTVIVKKQEIKEQMKFKIIIFSTLLSAFNLLAQTISGSVYKDLDFDNLITASDQVVSNLTINAYNDLNTLVATAVTDSLGAYSLNVGSTDDFRLEYDLISLSSSLSVAYHSSGINSEVVFAKGGDSAVDLLLIDNSDYCDENPEFTTVCYVKGDPLIDPTNTAGHTYPASGRDSIVSMKNDLSAAYSGPMPEVRHDGFSEETGSVYGVAYNRSNEHLYTSAFIKRFSGLGTLGVGGIYEIDYSAATPTVIPFMDLEALGQNLYDSSIYTTGYPDNVARGLVSDSLVNDDTKDLEGLVDVAKVGLGDLDISDDGNSLFVVNLFTKKVVSVDLTNHNLTGSSITTTEIAELPAYPNPNCNMGEDRPFGLKFNNGKIYLGVVCDGSDYPFSATPATSGNADLRALVFEYDFNTSLWVNIVDQTMDYQKGPAGGVGSTDCVFFEPWTDTNYNRHGFRCIGDIYLSDIEFDDNNDLILAFTNRSSHRNDNDEYWNAGEILRFAYDSGTNSYVVENAGTSINGGGCGITNPRAVNQGIGGAEYYCADSENINNHMETFIGSVALKPGSGELLVTAITPVIRRSGGVFFVNNSTGQINSARGDYRYTLYEGLDNINGEFAKAAGLGDIEFLCEAPELEIGNRVWLDLDTDGIQDPSEPPIAGVIITLYDLTNPSNPPIQVTTDSLGQYTFTGLSPYNQYEVVIDDPSNFASGGALEDLVLTSDSQGNGVNDSDGILNSNSDPSITLLTSGGGVNNFTYDFGFYPEVRIGNYVWLDTNSDGVQDSNEFGIPGVTVNIYDDQGNLVGSTITDSNGEYYFDVTGGQDYVIYLDNPADYAQGGPLVDIILTVVDSSVTSDALDSDAVLTSGFPCISLTAPTDGEDLTYDFGFYPEVRIGNYVWLDTNGDGVQDPEELGVPGVTVNIYDDQGNLVGSTITDSNGEYYFDVPAGQDYVIYLDNPADYAQGGPLEDLSLTVVDSATTSDALDSDAVLASGFPCISLTAPTEGEDLTYDFGFIEEIIEEEDDDDVEIGNYVWLDTNGDGVQDPEELGAPGVTVNIYDDQGNLVGSTITDSNGEYYFDVPAGKDYVIYLDNPADYAQGGPLEDFNLTFNDKGNDLNDSDALVVNGYPCISLTAPSSGFDHSYDFGFLTPQTQAEIDNAGIEISRLLIRQLKLVSSDKSSYDKKYCSKKKIRSLIKKSDDLYSKIWNMAWVDLKLSSNGVDCQMVSNLDTKRTIESKFRKLKKISKRISKCNSMNSKKALKLRRIINKKIKKVRKHIKKVPDSVRVCK